MYMNNYFIVKAQHLKTILTQIWILALQRNEELLFEEIEDGSSSNSLNSEGTNDNTLPRFSAGKAAIMDEFKIKGRIMDPSEIPIVSEMGFIMHIIAENGVRLEVGTILFATKITATICSLMTDQQSQAR
jgi:hypothetical protein